MASSVEVVEAASITYRQLDYWCRKGYLHPENEGAGSGNGRTFTDDEIAVAVRMARLVAVSIRPEVAELFARAAGRGSVPLGGGMCLVLHGPSVAGRRDPLYRSLERGQAA